MKQTKIFKSIFLALLLLANLPLQAQNIEPYTVTMQMSDLYGNESANVQPAPDVSSNGFTFSFDKGNSLNQPMYHNSGEMRLYCGTKENLDGNSMTVTSNVNITKMVLSGGSSFTYGEVTANTGTVSYDASTRVLTWTGSATSVVLTVCRADANTAAQFRFAKAVITSDRQPVVGDSFHIEDFTIQPGETQQVSIMLDNETVFSAIQADITLPEGLTIEQEDGEYLFDLTDRKARNHTVSSTTLSSGAIRVLVASPTSKTFSGNSGALITFNIIADASLSANCTISMSNVIASEADGTQHNLPSTTCAVTVAGVEPPVVGDSFYIEDFTIQPGETKLLSIMLDNQTVFSAIQADITLPEGLTIEQEDSDFLFDLTDRKGRDHTVSSTTLSSGAIRVLVASPTSKTFSGNSGALVTFNIVADASLSTDCTIGMSNVIASEANGTQHNLPNTTCVVTVDGGSQPPVTESITLDPIMAKLKPGNMLQITATGADNLTWTSSDSSVATVDANGNVTAVKSGLAAITATAPSGAKAWCAIFVYNPGDVNEDEEIDVRDITALIDIIMNS